MNIIATIEQEDAILFKNLSCFSWLIGVESPLVLDVDIPIYNQLKVNFDTLYELQGLDLIQFSPVNQFAKSNVPKTITVSYFGRSVVLTFPGDSGNEFSTGKVGFSRAGRQLATVCGASPVEGFFECVLGKWAGQGLKPKEIVDNVNSATN